jgi:alpha-amylase
VRRVEVDGFGESELNRIGPHYWLLDVEMDCAATLDGWFEVKAFLAGPNRWEPNVRQDGAPYATQNHLARCGALTILQWGSGTAGFEEFTP